MRKNWIRDLCYIGVFAAIMSVVSPLAMPTPVGVPFTFQTLIIPLAGVVLGPWRGMAATVVYVSLGIMGVPVFSGYGAGLGVIFGKTGGFILTFPAMALLAGLYLFVKSRKIGIGVLFFCLTLGTVVNFTGGVAMFSWVTGSTWTVAFAAIVLPYLPWAAVKLVLCGTLGPVLRWRLEKAGVL